MQNSYVAMNASSTDYRPMTRELRIFQSLFGSCHKMNWGHPLFAFESISTEPASQPPQQVDWHDEVALAQIFAAISAEEIALAEMGMSDFASTLTAIDDAR